MGHLKADLENILHFNLLYKQLYNQYITKKKQIFWIKSHCKSNKSTLKIALILVLSAKVVYSQYLLMLIFSQRLRQFFEFVLC